MTSLAEAQTHAHGLEKLRQALNGAMLDATLAGLKVVVSVDHITTIHGQTPRIEVEAFMPLDGVWVAT